jgi:hypothetical protein
MTDVSRERRKALVDAYRRTPKHRDRGYNNR